MSDSAQVIVGSSKPVMNYVTACITLLNQGAKKVVLRARGKAISVQLDTVQLLRRSFEDDLSILSMTIDSDSVVARDGRKLNLPVLEIVISRKGRAT